MRTNFVLDGDQIILESNAQHAITARYGYAGARPLYITRGTDTRYYVQENPGSIAGLFDATGQVTHRYHYYPFGARLGADTTETFANAIRFAGQYFDSETGLYHMRARSNGTCKTNPRHHRICTVPSGRSRVSSAEANTAIRVDCHSRGDPRQDRSPMSAYFWDTTLA